jgi:hypothetical protein
MYCRKYNNDSEFVKQLYRDLKHADGDVSYVHTLGLNEIMEVYPDAKIIHYCRHPYDQATSIVSSIDSTYVPDESDKEGEMVHSLLWTPQTGWWRGRGGSSFPVLSGICAHLRDLYNGQGKHGYTVGFSGGAGDGIHSNPVAQLASYWNVTHTILDTFCETLPADRTFFIRVEDYDQRLPELLDWLGYDGPLPDIANLNKRPYKKTPLTDSEKALVRSIAGELMKAYGYAA